MMTPSDTDPHPSPLAEKPARNGRVAVVGSANLDLVVRVDRHPRGGETVLGGELRESPGGKGANQAVAAARAGGAPTVFVGAVGVDAHADAVTATMRAAGVDLGVVQHLDTPTGVAMIAVSADGENAIVVAPGANFALRIGEKQERAIADATVVLAQLEVPIEQVITAARARSIDAVFIVNAAPSRPLPDDLIEHIDMLIVNEHEATELTSTHTNADPAQRARILAARIPTVIVTLGSAGVVIASTTDAGVAVTTLPAFSVTAVDTTGAGDTFCGALAARVAHGDALNEAVRYAMAASALAVTRAGAQEAISSPSEIAQFLSERS